MYDQGLHFTALGLFMLNPSAEYVVVLVWFLEETRLDLTVLVWFLEETRLDLMVLVWFLEEIRLSDLMVLVWFFEEILLVGLVLVLLDWVVVFFFKGFSCSSFSASNIVLLC